MTKEFFIDILKSRDIIVFGTGKRGTKIKTVLNKYNIDIQYFCDNDINKHGTKIDNAECISYEQLKKHHNSTIIVSMLENESVLKKISEDRFKYILTYDDFYRYFFEDIIELDDYSFLDANLRFKDLHKGERCFILGNGPSIKKQDLSLLKDDIVFSVNLASRIKQFNEFNPRYHFITDLDMLANTIESASTKDDLYLNIRNVITNKSITDIFVQHQFKKGIKNFVFSDDSVEINSILECNYPDDDLHINFTKPTNLFYTIVQHATTMAIYMGFKEIYLLGCDCTGILSQMSAYEKDTDKYHAYDSNRALDEKAITLRPFETIFSWNSKVFRDYKKIAQYCKEHDIIFKNCTEGGILDCVERANYEDIIKQKR